MLSKVEKYLQENLTPSLYTLLPYQTSALLRYRIQKADTINQYFSSEEDLLSFHTNYVSGEILSLYLSQIASSIEEKTILWFSIAAGPDENQIYPSFLHDLDYEILCININLEGKKNHLPLPKITSNDLFTVYEEKKTIIYDFHLPFPLDDPKAFQKIQTPFYQSIQTLFTNISKYNGLIFIADFFFFFQSDIYLEKETLYEIRFRHKLLEILSSTNGYYLYWTGKYSTDITFFPCIPDKKSFLPNFFQLQNLKSSYIVPGYKCSKIGNGYKRIQIFLNSQGKIEREYVD